MPNLSQLRGETRGEEKLVTEPQTSIQKKNLEKIKTRFQKENSKIHAGRDNLAESPGIWS